MAQLALFNIFYISLSSLKKIQFLLSNNAIVTLYKDTMHCQILLITLHITIISYIVGCSWIFYYILSNKY